MTSYRMALVALVFSSVFLLILIPPASSQCPKPCLCSSGSIVCTCSNTENDGSVVILEPFQEIDYIAKIFIHSCKRLRIPTDTFRGLAVTREFSIFNIEHLELEPFAFRLMSKCPDQLVFKDSSIAVIPEETFRGLRNLTHFWLRNVTIGTIKSDAFKGMENVQYLYFRESSINHIHEAAFGGMSNIDNLFIRGSTKIKEIQQSIFKHSGINNVFIEDALVDSVHPFSFSGIKFGKKMKLYNVTVKQIGLQPTPSTSRDVEEKEPVVWTGHLDEVEITHSRFSQLTLAQFSNVDRLKLEFVFIDALLPSSSAATHNISLLHISKAQIDNIAEGAFANAVDIDDFVFDEANIKQIQSHSFSSINATNFVVLNSKLRLINSLAFFNAQSKSMIFDGCEIDQIKADSFLNGRFKVMKVIGSVIRLIHDDAFHSIDVSEEFIFKYNKVFEVLPLPFRYLTTDRFVVSVNTFGDNYSPYTFNLISANWIDISTNHFTGCDCNQAYIELYRVQQKSMEIASHHIVIKADGNRCFNRRTNQSIALEDFYSKCKSSLLESKSSALSSSSNADKIGSSVAVKQHSKLSNGLLCEQSTLLTDCRCSDTTKAVDFSPDDALQLPTHTTVLVIRECERVTLKKNALQSSAVTQMHLFKIGSVRIESYAFNDAKALVSIVVDKSTIDRIDAFALISYKPLKTVRISNSHLKELRMDALRLADIDNMQIFDNVIEHLGANATYAVSIRNLTLLGNRIRAIQDDFVGKYSLIDNLHVVGNEIQRVDKNAIHQQSVFKQFLMQRNSFTCHCSDEFLSLLFSSYAQIDSKENVCYLPVILYDHRYRFDSSFLDNKGVALVKSVTLDDSCPQYYENLSYSSAAANLSKTASRSILIVVELNVFILFLKCTV